MINKLAVVGVGSWGQNLLRNFCAILGEERVVACDTDRKRLAAIKASYPYVHRTSDFSEVLDDPQIEAVVIATPVVTHFTLARQALLAGKHAFVEKPMAMRSSEAQELIRLAEQNRRILMVDHLLEYHPAVERLRQLLEEGELGEIFYIYSQRLNLGIIRMEENALWSLGPHDISVMLYLLGEEPHSVDAKGACYLQEGIEDVVFVTLKFPRGVRAHLHLSWLDPQKVRKLVVVGSRKMAVFDDVASQKLLLFDKGASKGPQDFVIYDRGMQSVALGSAEREPLRAACEHFLHCIERGEPPRSDGYDGLRVLRVLEAAQRSLDQDGQTVALEEEAS